MVWNPSVTCREVPFNGCWQGYHILDKFVLSHLKRKFHPQNSTSLACFQQEFYPPPLPIHPHLFLLYSELKPVLYAEVYFSLHLTVSY